MTTTANTPREPHYKFLDAGQRSPLGSGRWQPGRWRSVRGELVPCQNALHACRPQDLVYWLSGPELWTFAYDGDGYAVHDDSKVFGRRGRILARVEAWDERTARLFAADCAEHVLPVFERGRPDDDRPRQAIAAARQYALGEIDTAALAAAGDAAGAAARAAAWDAAWDAARAAARAAAGAAARDAARAAERRWQTERLLDLLGLPPLPTTPEDQP